MRSYSSVLILAASAAAAPTTIPADVQGPSTAGFEDATVHVSRGGFAVCASGFVDITASTSDNVKFKNFELPTTQSEATGFFVDLVSAGSTVAKDIMDGRQTINGTFRIGATLCTPANNTKPEQIQILSHGGGFDRTYWDFAPNYSYVDIAAQNNHATFFYDRLGIGLSSKPDALNIVQAPLQVSILHQLILKLRAGYFSNITPKQIVATGHSFGSAITQGLTVQFPSDVDATILTGWSVNTTGQNIFITGTHFALASHVDPYRFASLPPGYLVPDSAIGTQYGFFKTPGFDPEILSLADATKWTATFGELLTLATVVGVAEEYKDKPVAVVNGDSDVPLCDGNCAYPRNLAEEVFPALYPGTNKTGSYLAKMAGHGLNFHFSADEAWGFVMGFLDENL